MNDNNNYKYIENLLNNISLNSLEKFRILRKEQWSSKNVKMFVEISLGKIIE